MPTRLALLVAALAFTLAAATPARADVTPVTAHDSGVAAAVNGFRASLGADNGDQVGSGTGGRRQVDWEDVPDALLAPALLPSTFYDVQHPRGLVLSTPGRGVAVSPDDNAFSPTHTAAPQGSTVTDVTFRVPGTDTPAVVGGFGAVFTSGDGDTTTVEFFAADGSSLGTVTAPAGQPSFAGGTGAGIAHVRITTGTAADPVAMDDLVYGEPRQPLAVYTLGQPAYAAHENDGTLDVVVRRAGALGAGHVHVATVAGTAKAGSDFTPVDGRLAFAAGQTQATASVPLLSDTAGREGDETFSVALDTPEDGVLGDPATATVTLHDDRPPARVDRTRPRVTVAGVPRTMSRSRFLRGVRASVNTNEASSLQVTLLASARRAAISRVYGLQLGRKTYATARGTRSVRVRPSRRLVGSARRFTVRLQVLAIDRAGNRRALNRTVHISG
jgi:hypothetical protein